MKNLTFLLFVCLLCFSCGKKEEDPMVMEPEGSMTVIKDGVSFTIEQTNNTLVSDVQIDQTGRRLDVRCNVDGGTLVLTVSNWDFQNPPENGVLLKAYGTNEEAFSLNASCMEIGQATFCDGGLATYLIGTSEVYVSESLEDEGEGKITITGNDPTNKTVSGTFDLIVGKFGINGTEKIVFSGNFADLSYRVQ